MPPARVILVVGAAGSGKTALIQSLAKKEFQEVSGATIGLDTDAGHLSIAPAEAEDHSRLFLLLPDRGVELDIWELGGREMAKRELPRGRPVDGLMICYDTTDRTSFQRAAHLLMSFVVDRHIADTKVESSVRGRASYLGINGSWSKGTIRGDKLMWRHGQETQIQMTNGTVFETKLDDVLYVGELREDRIYWNDGDVWTRQDVPHRPAVQLCGTKSDEENSGAISTQEVQDFIRANKLHAAACTSAKTGEGVVQAFYDLVASILEADREGADNNQAIVDPMQARRSEMAAESWSLVCPNKAGHTGPMTSPRGARPFEPVRGALQRMQERPPVEDVEKLVEVLDQHGQATGTRTLGRCLQRGLRHRAVHVWLIVPRTGALLLRKYAPNASKHPGRWGPTVHGEILCYGSEGDGHAAEMSTQAAARSIKEQLGFDASEVGELEHWFSCTAQDGSCVEILDVHVAALEGKGLPSLNLRQGEEVDWAFFGNVFSDEAKRAGTVFKMEEEYILAMCRPLRARSVRHDVMNAFGQAAVTMLQRDNVRGFPPAG